MVYSRKYNLQSPLHHWYYQSCTIWGYNWVIILNIEYFLNNSFVSIFECSPRKWPMTQFKNTHAPPPPPPPPLYIRFLTKLVNQHIANLHITTITTCPLRWLQTTLKRKCSRHYGKKIMPNWTFGYITWLIDNIDLCLDLVVRSLMTFIVLTVALQ